MILFESDDVHEPMPDLAEELPAPLLVGRVAAEVDRLVVHCADLEAGLVPLLQSDMGTDLRTSLQSIDLLMQTLEALSGVLNLCAIQLPSDTIDVTTATASVKLRDIRDRLAQLEAAA